MSNPDDPLAKAGQVKIRVKINRPSNLLLQMLKEDKELNEAPADAEVTP